MSGNIINSKGTSVGKIVGSAIFDLRGQKLYAVRGSTSTSFLGSLLDILCEHRRCAAK
jgi:hypothetical protein